MVLGAVPSGCRRALDVGCGEGMLARRLRTLVPHVTGIDVDEPSLVLARGQSGDVDYVLGDVLAAPFPAASFDLVTSVAALHHVDAAAALGRMRTLLRPGGTLAVVGLARGRSVRDVPAVVATQMLRRRHGWWEPPSPTVWPPPLTYGEVRRVAEEVLPGCRFRRHLLWRWSLTWRVGTQAG